MAKLQALEGCIMAIIIVYVIVSGGSHIGGEARKGGILAISSPPRKHSHHSKQQPETPSSLFSPSDKSVNVPWNYLMTLLAKTSQGSPQNH